MPENSVEDPFNVSRSEGVALLRWSFTVVGAVMSALLVAASQAGENMSFYLMTITLFKFSLMIFLFLFGAVFATFVTAVMGHSNRSGRNRWDRVQKVGRRIGRFALLVERSRWYVAKLFTWSAFALAIAIGVILPAGLLHVGSDALKSDLELTTELQSLQISAFKAELSSIHDGRSE
ncbi:hypothetical protein [Yoonia maritima]|uniref:hypothetical protein n=1 Tax=Yoonia maritima TaxID=1435347 RepID=UPI000D0F92CF|nr:hypothetical protein [Yoonia maritima]